MTKVSSAVEKKWLKNMPRSVRGEEDKGIVILQLEIDSEGAVPKDGIRFHSVFASEALLEKALRSVREELIFTFAS